jgi:Putative peptidoglycan binding domain
VPNPRTASAAAINEDIPGHDRSLMGAMLAGLGRAGAFLWSVTCRRPFDVLGVVVASAGATAILVNALFLQARPHPAPMLSGISRPVAATNASAVPAPPSIRVSKREPAADTRRADAMPAPQPPVTVLPPPRPATAPAATAPAASASPATTATLPRHAEKSNPAPSPPMHAARPGAPSRRVLAVQRALTDFGYGQVKPTGVMSAETKSAIERFEREHKLPVTGQISDRLTRELASVTGRPID